MCGEHALILGIGRQFMEGDWFWKKYQIYTFEHYLNRKETFDPVKYEEYCKNNLFKPLIQSQQQADEATAHWKKITDERKDYHGTSVLFKSN